MRQTGGRKRLGQLAAAGPMALTCALLIWAPIPLGSNRPWSWSLLALLAAAALLLWAAGQLLAPGPRPRAVWPVALAAVTTIPVWGFAFLQTVPAASLAWLEPHPLWAQAIAAGMRRCGAAGGAGRGGGRRRADAADELCGGVLAGLAAGAGRGAGATPAGGDPGDDHGLRRLWAGGPSRRLGDDRLAAQDRLYRRRHRHLRQPQQFCHLCQSGRGDLPDTPGRAVPGRARAGRRPADRGAGGRAPGRPPLADRAGAGGPGDGVPAEPFARRAAQPGADRGGAGVPAVPGHPTPPGYRARRARGDAARGLGAARGQRRAHARAAGADRRQLRSRGRPAA